MNSGTRYDKTVVFKNFAVNLRTAEVFKNGRRVRLPGQAARVLVILLEQEGKLITREEFRDLLWPQETFVDFDHGLNNCINRVREVLGDSAASPKFIETLPKQGYRFIGVIQSAETRHVAEEVAVVDEPSAEVSELSEAIPINMPGPGNLLPILASPRNGRAWIIPGSFLVLFVTVVIFYNRVARPGSEITSFLPNVHAIAVLPLTNLAGDSSQDYLTDGITNELISELSRTTTASVISFNSVVSFKNKQAALPVVARELGVDATVEGTLKRSGNHLHIETRLRAANGDRPFWEKKYDGEMSEVRQIESRIAADIDAGIRSVAVAQASVQYQPVVSGEAYEDYLKGQFLWREWNVEPALKHFQRAVELEPNFAGAYAGIAKSYCRMESGQLVPASTAFPPANAAVEGLWSSILTMQMHTRQGLFYLRNGIGTGPDQKTNCIRR